jgi:predicted transposase YbfD/YdcC
MARVSGAPGTASMGKALSTWSGAWAANNELVLGQLKVLDKSNEITAIPLLLELLDIEGCIITIDAMGTQVDITQKVIDNKADYILSLKGNQQELLDQVSERFAKQEASSEDTAKEKGMDVSKAVNVRSSPIRDS